jgi:hypothetical protein
MDREQRCTHLKLMDSALEQPQQDEEEEEEWDNIARSMQVAASQA